jgi:hypothetical protein
MRGNLLGNSSRTRKPSAPIAQKANEPAAQFRLGSVVATVWRDGQSFCTGLAKLSRKEMITCIPTVSIPMIF